MTSNIDVGGTHESQPSTRDLPLVTLTSYDRRPVARAAKMAPKPRWERRLSYVTAASDIIAVLVVIGLGHLLGLGNRSPLYNGSIPPVVGLLVAALTIGCLLLTRAWDPRILGSGAEEFNRLLRGFLTAAIVLGLTGFALELPAVRPSVFGLLPLAGLVSLAGRFLLRKWLHRRRAAGRFVHPTLIVASAESAAELIRRTRRDKHAGWQVTGVCTPTGRGTGGGADVLGVPVLGDLDAVTDVARSGSYRVVSFGQAPGWSAHRLHQLAWDLEGTGTELAVDPGLMETAGPRLHITPVDGFPLLRLTHPVYDGVSSVAKSVVDRLGAMILLLAVLPVMLVLTIATKLDGGPAFFLQTRVGRHGKPFKMIKFRSMVTNAEALKEELREANEGAGPMFKMRDDPRITRVGAVLRRYSLDELPQLFNVLAGTMSLVGPRPPLPEEVATYERAAKRRLLVRPGITGLWQVGGRSDLSWEESLRLDLRYVENWTLAMDALIIWKTIGAMTRGSGR